MSSPVPPPSIPDSSTLSSRPLATAAELVGIENTFLLSFSFVILVDFYFFCWVAISTSFLCFYFIGDCRRFPAMPHLCGFDFFFCFLRGPTATLTPCCCSHLFLSMRMQETEGKKDNRTFPAYHPVHLIPRRQTTLLPESRMRDDFPGWWKSRQLATCNTDAARIGHRFMIQ
jgi:hypothetical protein